MCSSLPNSNKFMHVYKAQKDEKIILTNHYVLGRDQGFKVVESTESTLVQEAEN